MKRSIKNLVIAGFSFGLSLVWISDVYGVSLAVTGNADVLDYMIQNVCVDANGKVRPISPLDSACKKQRDLRLGEPLPYHKHDWDAQLPGGRQRGDSFPVFHAQLGLVAFHTFDWGDGVRQFGRYDGVNGDGGSLVAVGNGLVGSIMTIDQKGGVQMFVNGDHCHGLATTDSLLVGWPFAPEDLSAQPFGVFHSEIKKVKELDEPCPTRYAHAITAWYFIDFVPMSAPNIPGRRFLHALVSEHYSGLSIENSPNMERMYFSRELGRMRWERWQNLLLQNRPDDNARASTLSSGGSCIGGAGKPHHAGDWVMVACHEWTNIVPASNPGGDNPASWLSQLASATGAGLLLSLSNPP
jgi:hypothetical protein